MNLKHSRWIMDTYKTDMSGWPDFGVLYQERNDPLYYKDPVYFPISIDDDLQIVFLSMDPKSDFFSAMSEVFLAMKQHNEDMQSMADQALYEQEHDL